MGLRDAWLLAARLDRSLADTSRAIAAPTAETISREDLERALISLAPRVAELEHEWS
jgi:hypothetical protein